MRCAYVFYARPSWRQGSLKHRFFTYEPLGNSPRSAGVPGRPKITRKEVRSIVAAPCVEMCRVGTGAGEWQRGDYYPQHR